MEFNTRLKQANGILRSQKARVRIYQKDNKLLLRATLPPRPGAIKNFPHQQWIALNIQADSEGLKVAAAKARLISRQLDCKNFSWEPYLQGTSEKETKVLLTQDWIERFEQNYFSLRARTPQTETTWNGDYLGVFKKLDPNQPLSKEALVELILTTTPDTKNRRRYTLAVTALANFAEIPNDFKRLKGTYSSLKATPRSLPSDELIVQVRTGIDHPGWQWVFGTLATYGLRPHEIFHVSLEHFPVLYVLQGKTGFRHIRPIYPEWAEHWDLGNSKLPKCSGRNNQELGSRVSHAFKRLKIPFHAYDLRHRWAVRSMEWGLDLSLAAAEMGHSAHVHSTLYHRWISQSVHNKAFERLMNRPDRPKPPGC